LDQGRTKVEGRLHIAHLLGPLSNQGFS
jgi:hypothetical protein